VWRSRRKRLTHAPKRNESACSGMSEAERGARGAQRSAGRHVHTHAAQLRRGTGREAGAEGPHALGWSRHSTQLNFVWTFFVHVHRLAVQERGSSALGRARAPRRALRSALALGTDVAPALGTRE
jgi:hypothetical protein